MQLVGCDWKSIVFVNNCCFRPGVEETHDIHVKSSIARHKVVNDRLYSQWRVPMIIKKTRFPDASGNRKTRYPDASGNREL